MNFKLTIKFLVSIQVFVLLFGLASMDVNAQTFGQTKNPIDLKITNVTANGELKDTRKDGDNWVYDGELTKDDDIRYRWAGVDLNTKYNKIAASGGGYIKIYNNEVKPENFLADQGVDNYPLKVNDIAPKLANGQNKLQFVYVSANTNTGYLPVTFTFNFKNGSNKPAISVLKPDVGSVFMNGVEQNIQLQLNNFSLSNQVSGEKNIGKVKIYFEETKPANLVGTIASGIQQDNKYLVSLKSSDLNLAKVPDSNQTKLIFALSDTSDNLTGVQAELVVQTNYNSSLNVGLPRVLILEPKKDRSNNKVDNNTQFLLQVENFQILKDRQNLGTKPTADQKKGYLQIIITSGDKSQPIQPIWSKNDFTLNEIGYTDTLEGQRTIKIQLVNENFETLKPEATDSIEIFYTPANANQNTQEGGVQNNSWRVVIITLTVILIVGGISVLITRG